MSIAEPDKKSNNSSLVKKCFSARVKKVLSLNKPGSSKNNLHVILDLTDSNIKYQVGSCIGIYPDNHQEDVKEILEHLRIAPAHEIYDKRAEEIIDANTFFLKRINLTKITKAKASFIHSHTKNSTLEALLNDNDRWKTYTESNDIPSFLRSFLDTTIPVQEFCDLLLPLMPRFYSIASSQKMHADEVHLMVASFYNERGTKRRHSLTATHILECKEEVKDNLTIFLQENSHFTLPQDHDTPVIMIGPGTGMAAFRGFIQDRIADKIKGKMWLFTGDQKKAFDFHYQEELETAVEKGFLRLDTAFSRDNPHNKIYVQHKMLDSAKDLWDLIKNKNANIFVSGDAKSMAKDVTEALIQIASTQGGLSDQEAKAYYKSLRKDHRFVLDVY